MFPLTGYERYGRTELASFLEQELQRIQKASKFSLSGLSQLYVTDLCLRATTDFSFVPLGKTKIRRGALEEALAMEKEGVPLPANQNWRAYADALLFQTGFFPDSFPTEENRAHYIWIGQKAYQRFSQDFKNEDPVVQLMKELNRNFVLIGNMLTELRNEGEEQKTRTDNELYELQRICRERETAKLVYGSTLAKYQGRSPLLEKTLH